MFDVIVRDWMCSSVWLPAQTSCVFVINTDVVSTGINEYLAASSVVAYYRKKHKILAKF